MSIFLRALGLAFAVSVWLVTTGAKAAGIQFIEMALLGELLSLPSPATALNLSPQRKREMLFEAELHQLEALAKRRPVLMVFEDAHWIDPTSRGTPPIITSTAVAAQGDHTIPARGSRFETA